MELEPFAENLSSRTETGSWNLRRAIFISAVRTHDACRVDSSIGDCSIVGTAGMVRARMRR
jgi:hypothetical protein